MKRLAGTDLYSIRVGEYRVIVSIERNKMVVLVVTSGHKSTVYAK